MDEEKLEELKQKYEQSVINYNEALRIRKEKDDALSTAKFQYESAQRNAVITADEVSKNRKIYEDAVYKFWSINNE